MAQVPATLSVLRTRGDLRRMVVAYGIYDLVDIAIWVAIIFYAYDVGGVSLVGIVAVVQLIPAAFLGPALVGLGDRLPRGTALVLSHGGVAVATFATTIAILVSAPVPVVVTCSALATIAVSAVRPFHFASIPMLSTTPSDLVSANSLSSVADGFSLFLGPVAAGIGAALVGPALVLSVSSVLAVIATLLCVGLHLGPAAPFDDSATPSWRGAFSGLGTLWRDWGSLALLLVLTTRFVLGGATDVLGVAYSDEVLGLGESAAGLIIGAIGIGGIVGGALAGSLAVRSRLTPVLVSSGVAQGVAFAAVALIVLLAPAVVALAVSGMAAAVMMVAGRTLLQRTSDEAVMARVFAVQAGDVPARSGAGRDRRSVPGRPARARGGLRAVRDSCCAAHPRLPASAAQARRPRGAASSRERAPAFDPVPRRAPDVRTGTALATRGVARRSRRAGGRHPGRCRRPLLRHRRGAVRRLDRRGAASGGARTGDGLRRDRPAALRAANRHRHSGHGGPAAHGARRRLPGGGHGKPGRSCGGARSVAYPPRTRSRRSAGLPDATRQADRGGAVRDAQPGEGVLEVLADRGLGHGQSPSDLTVREALRHEPQDLPLPMGELGDTASHPLVKVVDLIEVRSEEGEQLHVAFAEVGADSRHRISLRSVDPLGGSETIT